MKAQFNDLLVNIIEANMDRIEGYKRAKALVNKTNFLTYLFDQCIKQSESYAERLNNLLVIQGANAIVRKSISNYFYRYWMGIKFYFASNKNKSVLFTCINAEQDLIEHYEEVLEDETLDFYFPLLRKILETQRNRITITQNKLNAYLGKEETIPFNESKLIPLNEVG